MQTGDNGSVNSKPANDPPGIILTFCFQGDKWLIVLCEMVLCETKRNEMKSVLCEMEICTLRNENLYFAK